MAAERISLKVEMGIRSLDTNRRVDHQDFMAAAERLITEVTAIKQGLQTAIADQAAQSQKAIEETHTAYESTISVLHATIARMQKSLTSNFHGPEILQLTKGYSQAALQVCCSKQLPTGRINEIILC